MKAIRNVHLVALIDVCDADDDLSYLIMEFCDNDLDRHLRHRTANVRLECAEEIR